MRILVIEDDKATARNIRQILKDDTSYIGIADLGKDGIARSEQHPYDLIILDLSLPDIHGLEVLRCLRDADVTTPILVLTGDASLDMLVTCLEAGADDYLTKPFRAHELLARTHALERRGMEASRLMAEARDAAQKMAPLTAREREVVERLVNGRSNKNVARELGVSPRTVEVHRAHIMEKLNARNLSDIVRVVLAAARLGGDGAGPAQLDGRDETRETKPASDPV